MPVALGLDPLRDLEFVSELEHGFSSLEKAREPMSLTPAAASAASFFLAAVFFGEGALMTVGFFSFFLAVVLSCGGAKTASASVRKSISLSRGNGCMSSEDEAKCTPNEFVVCQAI
jgi:hypothetical protein